MFEPGHEPWNQGKLVGQKLPLKQKEIWSIRVRLQLARRRRDLALFNLAVDSKLRGCDLVCLKVKDIGHPDRIAARATVMQQKTKRPVQFEITDGTRQALPVILGTLGGIGLIVGPIGLMVLRARRDPELGDRSQDAMDSGFLVLLMLTSVTGLALLAWREAHAMGVLLALHLGAVMALFLTMPYGKLVHALYRFGALLRFHVERRRPLPQVGTE